MPGVSARDGEATGAMSAFIAGTDAPWRSLTLDAGRAERFTISDAGALLYQVFLLPGDSLLWLILTRAPELARFLELSPDHYGGALSGFVSGLSWLLLLLTGGAAFDAIRAADMRLTRSIRNACTEVLLAVRRGRVRLAARREKRARRQTSP